MAQFYPARRRGLGRRFTRRTVLKGTALGATGLAAAAFLGCEDDNGGNGGNGAGALDALSISNWPYYIDADTVANFQDETGITTSYTQDISDNDEFFGKIREPLSRGQDIGRDIIVHTDWMAARLIRLGYVEELDKANIPNWVNLRDDLENVAFDPGRKYSLTWQSGFTGIGYNPELTGRELTSIDDIFDEAFSGHVTMLTEMRDTVGLTLLTMGKDPATATVDDCLAAIDKVSEYARSGHIRAFTTNEYGDDLVRGDVWAAFAWSGDVIQLSQEDPNIKLLLPEQGFMVWSDNALIPKNAKHKAEAEAFLDYVYDPANQALISAYVQFISPVDGTKEAIVDIDPALADNQLIFPNEQTLANAKTFRPLDEEEEREVNEAFLTLIGA
ncbi:MAG: spermidine/putrescine ABC transporter substrate-binding protein [Dehalococcoidia bacterium]